MKFFKYIIIFILLTISYTTSAAIFWVGSSPACSGANVYNNFNSARTAAALNGLASNEIRMTRTIDYIGALGRISIAGEFGSRQIIISGGYSDCFSTQSERTFIGSSNASSFDINTGAQPSNIILRSLILAFNDSRGVVARGDVFLQLDNVDINNNGFSGLDVGAGASVEVFSNSLIRFNQNISNPNGGGIRCTNTDSFVTLSGKVEFNKADKGGNIYLGDGCFMHILDGSRITGLNNVISARFGAGIYVDNGGQLLVEGKANRVIINDNWAEIQGGGLYLNGTGFALLENTHFNNNKAEIGSDILALNGGTIIPQLIMDQTAECGLMFACSEIQNSRYKVSAIQAVNSFITINRTVIEKGQFYEPPGFLAGLITSESEGLIQLNRVGILNNEAMSILSSRSISNNHTSFRVAHLTAAGNTGLGNERYSIFALQGIAYIENSIFTDTLGAENRSGIIVGKCNLVNNQTDWPMGTYHVGTPVLSNLAGGDARQLSNSMGVDMCQQNTFGFSNTDIENQAAPVNENTNPQGMPGEIDGLYDAGFDEVYDNIGEDEFLLSVSKEGSGSGSVVSSFPAGGGINCGVDCSEIYFRGTIVFLTASADNGSQFVSWNNCTEINNDNQCLINMQSSSTIRAAFRTLEEVIFSNGFE